MFPEIARVASRFLQRALSSIDQWVRCLWKLGIQQKKRLLSHMLHGTEIFTYIDILGGETSIIFYTFLPRSLGTWSNLTSIFFKWVGEKPLTRGRGWWLDFTTLRGSLGTNVSPPSWHFWRWFSKLPHMGYEHPFPGGYDLIWFSII